MFKKSLKKDVKNQFMWNDRWYNELDIFYEVAIELDNKFYERRIEKNPKKAYYWPGLERYFKIKKFYNNYFNQNYDLMEFDTTKEQSKGRMSKEQFKRKKSVKYYNYGKPGYIKQNCRQSIKGNQCIGYV